MRGHPLPKAATYRGNVSGYFFFNTFFNINSKNVPSLMSLEISHISYHVQHTLCLMVTHMKSNVNCALGGILKYFDVETSFAMVGRYFKLSIKDGVVPLNGTKQTS